jgi:hypothetical protein
MGLREQEVRNPKKTHKHPEEFRELSVKPLDLIWSKFPQVCVCVRASTREPYTTRADNNDAALVPLLLSA